MEETPEQLKARIAELEKQLQGRRSHNLEFRVDDKRSVSVYASGPFMEVRRLRKVHRVRELIAVPCKWFSCWIDLLSSCRWMTNTGSIASICDFGCPEIVRLGKWFDMPVFGLSSFFTASGHSGE
jgi:hypothetical protein